MKLLVVVLSALVLSEAKLKCYVKDGDKVESKECTNDDDTCGNGVYAAFKGYEGIPQRCLTKGECGDDNKIGVDGSDKGKACASCNTENCNKLDETENYECFTFNYNATSKESTKKDAADYAKCVVKKDEKKTCVSMKKQDGDSPNLKYKDGGCGACGDNEAAFCVQCEGDKCSSAIKVTFNVLALLAVLKALF